VDFRSVSNIRKNNHAKNWNVKASGVDDVNTITAKSRFEQKDFFCIENKPKFKIDKSSQIYTIGSCFARNVEKALVANDVNVPTWDVNIDKNIYKAKTEYHNTVLNKYNPYSMAAEINTCLQPEHVPGADLIQLAEDKYYDPQTSHTRVMTLKEALKLREEMVRLSKKIISSDYIFMTLGMSETWWLTNENLAFNLFPAEIIKQIRSKIHFQNATVNETVQVLQEAITNLQSINPKVKVIITVSPVPMRVTFTDQDVVSANTYSKSVLRCAAHELAMANDFVDYFPSYEMVTNSARDKTWAQDMVHVNSSIVSKVIATFVQRYIAD
jgi:hypothetical protein